LNYTTSTSAAFPAKISWFPAGRTPRMFQRGQDLPGTVEVFDGRSARARLHHLPAADTHHVVEHHHPAGLHAHERKVATERAGRS
jgi:hypothetical protein